MPLRIAGILSPSVLKWTTRRCALIGLVFKVRLFVASSVEATSSHMCPYVYIVEWFTYFLYRLKPVVFPSFLRLRLFCGLRMWPAHRTALSL